MTNKRFKNVLYAIFIKNIGLKFLAALLVVLFYVVIKF